MASPSPWLPPFARWALLLSVLGAVVGGWSYLSWATEWNRPRPRIARCIADSTIKLRKPEMQSGTEPHDTPDGRTVYLTPAADGAVRCVSLLSGDLSKRLADALGEQDPEARAGKLAAMIEAIPRDESSDLEALSIGYLAQSTLKAQPQSEPVVAAAAQISEHVDCRFNGRPCAVRPPIPVLAHVGGAVAALGLLVVVGQLGRSSVARRKAEPATPPSAPAPAPVPASKKASTKTSKSDVTTEDPAA